MLIAESLQLCVVYWIFFLSFLRPGHGEIMSKKTGFKAFYRHFYSIWYARIVAFLLFVLFLCPKSVDFNIIISLCSKMTFSCKYVFCVQSNAKFSVFISFFFSNCTYCQCGTQFSFSPLPTNIVLHTKSPNEKFPILFLYLEINILHRNDFPSIIEWISSNEIHLTQNISLKKVN